MTRKDAIAICLWCILAMMLYSVITFGISFAIAYLVVEMGFLNVGVGKLALLIWLVKLLMSNHNTNEHMRKHE